MPVFERVGTSRAPKSPRSRKGLFVPSKSLGGGMNESRVPWEDVSSLLHSLFSRLSPRPPPPLAPPRPRLPPPRPGGLPGRRLAPLPFLSGGIAAETGRFLLPMETRSLLLHLKLLELAGEGGATLRRPQKGLRRRSSEPHLNLPLLPASRFRMDPDSTRLSLSRHAGP